MRVVVYQKMQVHTVKLAHYVSHCFGNLTLVNSNHKNVVVHPEFVAVIFPRLTASRFP